jgi:hypothetical protein
MGSFLSGIFGGSSPGVSQAQQTAQGGAGYGFSNGQKNEDAAGDYYGGILSGDPTKIAQSLAPAIQANQQQGQQQKQTMAQFGTRSGGNTGAADNIDTATRGNTVNLIGGALNNAAAGEAGLGENQVQSGTQNNQAAGNFSEEELKNQQNSILGQMIGGLGATAGTAITGGLGMIPGLSSVI